MSHKVPVKSPNEDEQFVEVDALNYSREEVAKYEEAREYNLPWTYM